MEYHTLSDKSEATDSAGTIGAGGDNNSGVEETSCEPRPTDILMKEVENVLEELNEKRDSDKNLVGEFRTKMHGLVDDLCGQLEQQLFATYEKTNSTVQSKLDSLKDLGRQITVAETELADFEKAVSIFFRNETTATSQY